MSRQQQAAHRLHHYLRERHWNGAALIGPDPGIRLNYRIGRFVKGYLPRVRWGDDYYYLQGQGYWTLGNWRLWELQGDGPYRDIALRCAEHMLQQQQPDGAWPYPNPEWKGRIATAEGTWGSLGLVETYRHTGDTAFLDGALRWHRFLIDTIGFQRDGDRLAINYFAHRSGSRVPNNSITVLRFLAELAAATDDTTYMQPCAGLLRFIADVQKPTGEFPYTVPGVTDGEATPHFQCAQYNAFECLNLIRYYELTGDTEILPLIERLLGFLRTSQGQDGHADYQCGNHYRAVTYHAAALGAAFARAADAGIAGYDEPAARAYDYVLRWQRPDGGFPHSHGDYRLLSDRRSYPRYLAMILYLLLVTAPAAAPVAISPARLHEVRL